MKGESGKTNTQLEVKMTSYSPVESETKMLKDIFAITKLKIDTWMFSSDRLIPFMVSLTFSHERKMLLDRISKKCNINYLPRTSKGLRYWLA